jgi:hypothetical protein
MNVVKLLLWWDADGGSSKSAGCGTLKLSPLERALPQNQSCFKLSLRITILPSRAFPFWTRA